MRVYWHAVIATLSVMTSATVAAAAVPGSAHPWPSTAAQATPPSGTRAIAIDHAGSVVVIPFTNISEDAADDWLGDGIAETVSADLESLGELTVIAQERVRAAARGRRAPVLDDGLVTALGHELGARWVVTGGYQRVGNQLRITARLVDTDSGLVAKTAKVDGTLDDIFALQDRIVSELSAEWVGVGTGGVDAVSDAAGTAGELRPSQVTGVIILDGDPVNRARRGGEPGGRGDPGDGPAVDAAAFGGVGIATSAGILTGHPRVTAVPADEPPRIDGRLDDAVWRRASRITDFVQTRPLDGAPASEVTEVYITYDSQNIYFGIYAHYSDLGSIRANRSDRDETFEDDTVSVYFDPFLDQQRAYVFSVNGYGVQADSIMRAVGGGGGGGVRAGGFNRGSSGRSGQLPRGDSSWDTFFESGGMLVEDGWTAEMAIPFQSLRYPRRASGEQQQWGFQIARSVQSKDETDVWSPISRDIAGFLPQMGVLEGIANVSTSRTKEILPTLTAIRFGSLNSTTGQFEDRDTRPEGGVNFKYGITPGLTADLTYNPDFSQIQSDLPQIENNQRFALFFPELRPFFLEGAEIFSTGGGLNLVHTRTIVDPRYGGKLTGKVGNTTLGVLVANDEAPGNVDDPTNPAYGKTAQVFIGRVRYDLYAESHVGAIVTDREFLDTYSRLGGIDAQFRLGPTHRIGIQFIQSQHRDTAGNVRSGPIFHFGLGNRGRHLDYFLTADSVDPDFRADTGFVRRVDIRQIRTNATYRWWPEGWIINWGPRVAYSRNYNFDDILQDEEASLGLNASFAKNISVNATVNRDMERFNQTDFFKTRMILNGNVNTSRRFSIGGRFQWGDEVSFTDNPFLGRVSQGELFMTLRPSSRLTADIIVQTSRLSDPGNTGAEVFDVKIFRSFTTYQLTGRLLLRNITEYNTFDRTLGLNVLLTYRANAGTAFFIGYDDHYREGNLIDDALFTPTALKRTNRAFFTKLSYLFRY